METDDLVVDATNLLIVMTTTKPVKGHATSKQLGSGKLNHCINRRIGFDETRQRTCYFKAIGKWKAESLHQPTYRFCIPVER